MIKALRALSFHTLYNMQPFGVIAFVSSITKVLSYKLWYCYFSTLVVKRTTLFEMLGILCDSFVVVKRTTLFGMLGILCDSFVVVKRTSLFEMLGILYDSFVFEIKFSMLSMRPLLPHYCTRSSAFQFTMLGTENNCIAL